MVSWWSPFTRQRLSHTFRVEKSGFTTAAGTLTMPDAGATTKAYAVLRPVSTPTPSATYGALSVDSSPQGAKIYLNGYYRGISPFSFDQLTPGSYTVDTVLDGYRPYYNHGQDLGGQHHECLHYAPATIFITKFNICHFRSHECLCLS